jgi:hypothetical protein
MRHDRITALSDMENGDAWTAKRDGTWLGGAVRTSRHMVEEPRGIDLAAEKHQACVVDSFGCS